MKVEVDVPSSPYGLCGRKAKIKGTEQVTNCVEVEVDVLGSPSRPVSGRKATLKRKNCSAGFCRNLKFACSTRYKIIRSTRVFVEYDAYILLIKLMLWSFTC